MAESRPPWCGHCDRRTRLILIRTDPANSARDIVVRCQACNPHADTGCTRHVQPPGSTTCTLCETARPDPLPPEQAAVRAGQVRSMLTGS